MPARFGFTTGEAAVLEDARIPAQADAEAYPPSMAPSQLYRMLVFDIRASLDLGLEGQARRRFADLKALVDRHPGLATRARSRPLAGLDGAITGAMPAIRRRSLTFGNSVRRMVAREGFEPPTQGL